MVAEKTPQGIHHALLKVQAELRPIMRNSEGQIQTRKYSYADMAALMAKLQPLFTKYGIVVIQTPRVFFDSTTSLPVVEMTTELVHAESGTFITGTLAMPAAARTAQAVGSASAYARRYAIMPMVGAVVEGEDDDGKEASQSQAAAAPARRPAPQPTAAPNGKPGPEDWLTFRSLLAEWRGVTAEEIGREDIAKVAVDYARRKDAAAVTTKASLMEQIVALRRHFDQDTDVSEAAAMIAVGEQAKEKVA